MALKDLGDSIADFAAIGLVIGKKVHARAIADERDLDPGMVQRLVEGLHPERLAPRAPAR